MNIWEVLYLVGGVLLFFISIVWIFNSGSPLALFSISIGVYFALVALSREYFHYFNPELILFIIVMFQGLILAYIFIFEPSYLWNLLFYMYIGAFLICLSDLLVTYNAISTCS